MNEDTKLSDLTVAEFRKLMQECLQIDMDATKEVAMLRWAFINNRVLDQISSNPYPSK
jgi:hypothetical protein